MKLILWDFDGTLAQREGMWSGTLASLANRFYPDYKIAVEDIAPSLQKGFPWHAWEMYYGNRTADEWWSDLVPVFEQAYIRAGVQLTHAKSLALAVRHEYTNINCWKIYDDVVTSLQYFSSVGWHHYIVSNHVPELAELVKELKLDSYFDHVFTSAIIGYEKPNQGIFKHVRSKLPAHDKIWMIGDSYNADVRGASEANIPAVLVRNTHAAANLQCSSLLDLSRIII